jgi:DNA-binding transcriptional MocR family regulator
VFACNGVQHALSVIFAALATAGDAVATEALNYPGLRLLADVYGLRLISLPMDKEGLQVDALQEACRRERVKFVLCSPTMHNPTTITMSRQRREDLAHAACSYDLTIIENDILGMMPPEPLPTLAAFVPERCCYVTGLTKVVAAGLRLGFIVAPATMLGRLTAAVRGTTWMPSPLMSEIFTMWVEDGSMNSIIDWHRCEVRARVELARHLLGGTLLKYDHAAYHLWLPLAKPWRQDEFASLAHSRGVSVLPAQAFLVSRNTSAPQAVRVSLGGVNSRERIRKGLRVLAELIAEGPPATVHP